MKKTIYIIIPFLIFLSGRVISAPHIEHVLHKGNTEIVGWEIRSVINRNFSYRFNGHNRTGLHKKDEDFVVQTLRLDNKAVSALFDFHPMKGSFRTTIGVFVGSNDIDLFAAPFVDEVTQSITFDIDKSDLPEELAFEGTVVDLRALNLDDRIPDSVSIESQNVQLNRDDISVTAQARYSSLSPYFGVGWGNAPYSRSRVRYSVDIGVIYYGKPRLGINVDGKIANIHPFLTAELNEYVQEQEQELQQKYNKYRFLPFVTLGVSVLF